MKSQESYLRHVLFCIQRIREDAAGGWPAVSESLTVQDAILRNLQVLCESCQRLDDGLKATHPEVAWKAISGMRNVLVHDYFAIDIELVWQIVERDLPVLEEAVRKMLDVLTQGSS